MKKESRVIIKKCIDGRKIVSDLLIEMDRLNDRPDPQILESRESLMQALNQFCGLSAKEKKRFVSALNEYVGSAMQGGTLHADLFSRLSAHQLEGAMLRIGTMSRVDAAASDSALAS